MCQALKQRDVLRIQLRQAPSAKEKLIQQLEKLNVINRHYDRKYQNMQDRLDALYGRIADLEERVDFVELMSRIKEKQARNPLIYGRLRDWILNRLTGAECFAGTYLWDTF